MSNPKTFPVAMTFAELSEVARLIKAEYDREAYWANRPDDDVADEVSDDEVDEDGKPVVLKSRKWERDQRDKSRVTIGKLSDLHFSITGEQLR